MRDDLVASSNKALPIIASIFPINFLRRFLRKWKLERDIQKKPLDKKLLQEIDELYEWEYNYKKRLKLYNYLLTLNDINLTEEDKAIVYQKLALAYFDLGQLDKAKENFEKAMEFLKNANENIVELVDLKASNFYHLCLLFNYDKKFADLAIEQFEKIIKKYPEYEYIHYIYLYYADLLSYMNEYDKAISICFEAEKKVKDDSQKADIHHTIGNIFIKKQYFRDAEKHYIRSLELYGLNRQFYSRVYYDLGKLYIEKGDNKKAKEIFQKALKYKCYSSWLKNRSDYIIEMKGYLS